MATKNRFSAVKAKMDANFDNSTIEEAVDNFEERDQETEATGGQHKITGDESGASGKESQAQQPAKQIQTEQAQEVRMTRKTTSMPLVLDLAIKELKDRRNLARLKGKGRTTEDDIMVEALRFYFSREGEFIDCFNAAENKLRSYS